LRSFRRSPRESLVRKGASSAYVRAETTDAGRRTLVEVEISGSGRDVVRKNRQRVLRVADLAESARCTVFTPDDLALVKGGPQERRDYLDDVLVAARPLLAPVRQSLERALRQRNVLLRQAAGRATAEVLATLDVWDATLAEAGRVLTEAREALVAELGPPASAAYGRLTGTGAGLDLAYRRSYSGDLADALAEGRAEDLRRGVTGLGPHRDEVEVTSAGLDARSRLSQGRQRCVTLALRLASHSVVWAHAGSAPILLLDDAFSELDESTAAALLRELPSGQALLTTAGPVPHGARPDAVVTVRDGTVVS
ncbi:MAG: DNA replication and repair protein RecF, partial [Actinomycetota bacterium]|nr:DNA replication and repair protein RecF [Actinomycetota bacterium]